MAEHEARLRMSVTVEAEIEGVWIIWRDGSNFSEVVMGTAGDPVAHCVERILTGPPGVSAHPRAFLRGCLLTWLRDHYADAWRYA